jgi:hypothetical protein
MRPLLRALLAIGIGAPLLALTPGPAAACSCVVREPRRVIDGADAIVAGRVVGQAALDQTHTMSSVAVDGVYVGRVGAMLTLRSDVGTGGGADCAVLYPVGSTIDPLVLSERPDGTYQVEGCALPVMRQVATLLGEAHPPQADGPAAVPLPSHVPAPPPAAAPAPGPNGISWPAVLGGTLAGIGLMVWALRRSARGTPGAEPAEDAAGGSEAGDIGGPPAEPSG